jgi:selT/selW/selH-like putative selenoprotein
VKGGRGDFIVTVDGEEVWNKNRSGRGFPDPDELVEDLRADRA